VFSLLFTALGLEAALRIAYHRSMDFSMEMWKYAVQLKRPVFDPRLSFAHEPNSHGFFKGQDVKINSQGLRDYEYSLAKPAGVYRILLLGDSTTFGFRDYEYSLTKPLGVYRILLLLGDSTTLGWGVSMNETAAKILERELNAVTVPGYERFEVLNAGVGNYDTVQEVTYYQTRGRNFHPDMVILVYFINDPEPVPVENKTFLITRFYLVAYVTNRFDGVLRRLGTRPDWKAYCASLYNDDRPGFQACKAALRDLVAATREDHAKLIVALLPELHQINDSYPLHRRPSEDQGCSGAGAGAGLGTHRWPAQSRAGNHALGNHAGRSP